MIGPFASWHILKRTWNNNTRSLPITLNLNTGATTCHADAKRRQGCELYAFIIEIRMREAYDLHDLSQWRTHVERSRQTL